MAMSLEEFEALPEKKRHKRWDKRKDGALFLRYVKHKTKAGIRVSEGWRLPEESKRGKSMSEEAFLSLPVRKRCGDTRDDGFRFVGYSRVKSKTRGVLVLESWANPTSFEEGRRSRREWGHKNKEKKRALTAAYNARTKEIRAEKDFARWASNPERRRAQKEASHKSYKRNRAKVAMRARARKKITDAQFADLSLSQQGIVATIYAAADRLTACLGVPFQVDHIKPIASGGAHAPGNLQAIPARLNARKKTKLPDRWSPEIRAWIPECRWGGV